MQMLQNLTIPANLLAKMQNSITNLAPVHYQIDHEKDLHLASKFLK
jgi:hypothetical protein